MKNLNNHSSLLRMILTTLTLSFFIVGCGDDDPNTEGNHKPTVKITQNNKTVKVGDTIRLNADANDQDGDTLTYKWSFTSKPSGSTASLLTPTSKKTSFTVDKKGKYKVEFTAKDTVDASKSDSITITATEASANSNPSSNAQKGSELWSYKFNDLVDTLVPALDEKGNLYFAENTNKYSDDPSKKSFIVTSLDKNGKKRWSKTFNKEVGYSKIMYKNNQVFCITNKSVQMFENPEGVNIYALNSSDGKIKWHTLEKDYKFTTIYQSFAVTNKKLYVFMMKGFTEGNGKIVSYDTTTGKEKGIYNLEKNKNSTSTPSLTVMSVFNNHIYFLVPDTEKIYKIKDLGESLVKDWSLELNSNGEYYAHAIGINTLALDSKENIYVVTAESGKHNSIYSISKDGQLNWKNEFESARVRLPSPITINKNDIIYSTTPSHLYSVSTTGRTRWSLVNAEHSRITLEQDFQRSPTIGENGKTYHKATYGLATANSDGSLDWEYIVENDQHASVNAEYSTLNINGNLIAMGLKGISCYKVDNTKLDSAGWSKLYGNAGNTSSREK